MHQRLVRPMVPDLLFAPTRRQRGLAMTVVAVAEFESDGESRRM